MAEMDNISEINENFDTIKTLLNSIRAQGILNTSDVDKLLTGINTKLEKINTEEDIDLIKIFLSELKQNLDERHSILISKFGAIESLFSNLLKNSSEAPKSSEMKELFDIVATNLSVFSREVVSQKETLTEISLRLDALRSDDSQKKDIIKNITLLKPDLERLNNGFDSIVISLNDNFKTLAKTITAIDKTEHLDKFAESINGIEMSSNTILSALQMLDKKAEMVDESLKGLATKEDITSAERRLFDLTAQSHELSAAVSNLSERYIRIDNLADKIDASVSVIAGLKSFLEESENSNTLQILEKLAILETELKTVSDDTKFDELKLSLQTLLNQVSENVGLLDRSVLTSVDEIKKIDSIIKALDINTNFQNILTSIAKSELGVKNCVDEAREKILNLHDANISRVLNELNTNADSLGSKLSQTQSELAVLCEKNFGSVIQNIVDLKNVVSQIDENSVSANNAIFSSITDRLTIFENSLKTSLETQEQTVSNSSAQLIEQIDNIKNISSVLDYKMDSSVVEVGNVKREFNTLKTAIEDVLALDFVNTVKDLRVDLYASKQELSNMYESTTNDLSEKFTNDLYGKYELLISKLDTVEDEFKKVQTEALGSVKSVLDNISSSLVDVLSYVSESRPSAFEGLEDKLNSVSEAVKENSMNYIEGVRDVVDVIRVQIESNLKSIDSEIENGFDTVKKAISENSDDIKKELKYSYSKILEIQDSYNELKEILNINQLNSSDKFDGILASAETVKNEFDTKLSTLKSVLLDKISDFKQEFTCENADKISELKFAVESLYNKNSHDFTQVINELTALVSNTSSESANSRTAFLAKVLDSFVSVKDLINTLNKNSEALLLKKLEEVDNNVLLVEPVVATVRESLSEELNTKVSEVISDVSSVKSLMNDLNQQTSNQIDSKLDDVLSDVSSVKDYVKEISEETSSELASKIDTVMADFATVKTLMNNLNDKSAETLANKVDVILEDFASVKQILDKVDENIDGDMTRQLSIIESNFESLVSQITILFDHSDRSIADKIKNEFSDISVQINESVAEKLESYKQKIEETFDGLSVKTSEQSKYLQERIADLNSALKSIWDEQSEDNNKMLDNIAETLKSVLETNSDTVSKDYKVLQEDVAEFAKNISAENLALTQDLKAQVDDIVKYLDSVLDIQAKDLVEQQSELLTALDTNKEAIKNSEAGLRKVAAQQLAVANETQSALQSLAQICSNNNNLVDELESVTKEQYEALSARLEQTLEVTQAVNSTAQKTESVLSSTKNNISSLANTLNENKNILTNLEESLSEKFITMKSLAAEISAGELQTLDTYVNKLAEQIDSSKQSIQICKDAIVEILKKEISLLSKNVEKETDVIIAELIEQFDLLKQSQNDDIVNLTSRIEEVVTSQVYNNIEDLKSYLDIKTDSSVISGKLDNLKIEISSAVEELVTGMDKMLAADVFTSAMSDYRLANELFINTAVDRINDKIEAFISENNAEISVAITDTGKSLTEKLSVFDKKFVDTVVDKFEEIKLISNQYSNSFSEIKENISGILVEFDSVKSDVNKKLEELIDEIKKSAQSTNEEVKVLADSFESLKAQISSKTFEEAFQASINKQIGELETLVNEQLEYISDINELCATNLPDVSELNTVVKYSVLDSLDKLKDKIDNQNIAEVIELDLNQTKADIITQILNIFNQISFVAEQEEIIDFIQEKHDELITILSHIVTTSQDVGDIKVTVDNVDAKIDSLKEEIEFINEKITSIISADGEIDYVYSLQDLESDIANLRLVLNDMKESVSGNTDEFKALVNSTNDIYALVESIKTELPGKNDLEGIAEDIVSISSRTNKLILASDESYKTLQDNLQDFKLVINDLDERTKNFARESGIERVDSKLNAINTMMINGAKTNQVFNQVFEYLAEWVDNASVQINSISDKVETLDDIGQIKVMLADLKAEAEDNSESVELIEALGTVFDKQTKRISSLEAKLDKMIVETTINNKNNKIDLAPMEETLNRFLVAMDEKMSSQQNKINSLEAKLESVMELLDEKDTAQLTKKVGGMDRQIAKLNKSIEKIASHVVEK